ncbi:MAG: alpha/beta hydrolase [Anaerolineaceae bacterium]
MATATATGIRVWYETFGDHHATPILLVMGQGAQATGWPRPFCELLAGNGRFVVRFDNRDTGLSTWFQDDDHYDLGDMAADVGVLLDALGIACVHVVGASMGGAIGQVMAIGSPERVASLVSIMSSAGLGDERGTEATGLLDLFERERLTDDEDGIRESVESWRLCAGTTRAFDDQWWYEFVREQHERAPNPLANAHHRAAMLRSGSRRDALSSVQAPTLVIHGDEDPLVPLAEGEEVARLISGARLLVVPGMGHELPPWTWDYLIPAIVEHTRTATDRL